MEILKMRRYGLILSVFVILLLGLYGCSNEKDEETTYDMAGAISQMESVAIDEREPISIATKLDDKGELADIINVSVIESYMETKKITKAPLEPLKNTPDTFVDSKGNLKNNYSFIGVKLNIDSDKDLKVNIASFRLRGIINGEYLSTECFYQNGKNVSDNIHDSGIIEIKEGEKTEITLGFFVDKEMAKSENYYLVPEFFDTGEDQGNYIELTVEEK